MVALVLAVHFVSQQMKVVSTAQEERLEPYLVLYQLLMGSAGEVLLVLVV